MSYLITTASEESHDQDTSCRILHHESQFVHPILEEVSVQASGSKDLKMPATNTSSPIKPSEKILRTKEVNHLFRCGTFLPKVTILDV